MNRFKKIHVCIALTLLCAILLGSVCLVHNLTNNRDNIEYDMDILYHNGRENDIYVRLSRSGEYEMYYGAVFYGKEKCTGIPTTFYDIRRKKISKVVCNNIFCAIDELNNIDVNWDYDRDCDRTYIITTIDGKRYVCFLDKIDEYSYGETLSKTCNYLMENLPKTRWKEKYLKMYNENGDIVTWDGSVE